MASTLQSAVTLSLVFAFAFSYGLPLHVVGSVRSAALKRIDVVDDVPRATSARSTGRRAWVLSLELILRGCAALVTTVMDRARTV